MTASVVHPSEREPGAGGCCQYDRAVEPVGVVAFERLVAEALDGLPADLAGLMDNVVVLTADRGDPPDLLGLYDGVPLTQREDYGGLVMRDVDELRHEVAVTVVHEVAHHFGIDDDRLDELGWA